MNKTKEYLKSIELFTPDLFKVEKALEIQKVEIINLIKSIDKNGPTEVNGGFSVSHAIQKIKEL